MNPEELIKALRYAIASGAIIVEPHYSSYPATEIEMIHQDDCLTLSWTGADITLLPQGSASKSSVERKVQDFS